MSDQPSAPALPDVLPEGIKKCAICGKPYKDTGEGCQRCLDAIDNEKDTSAGTRRVMFLAALLLVLLLVWWTRAWQVLL